MWAFQKHHSPRIPNCLVLHSYDTVTHAQKARSEKWSHTLSNGETSSDAPPALKARAPVVISHSHPTLLRSKHNICQSTDIFQLLLMKNQRLSHSAKLGEAKSGAASQSLPSDEKGVRHN
jgi:hypothetical protein